MKNLIIYKSNTGHTKEYSEMLERRISGKLISIDNLKKNDIKEADNIFYGGPLRNNVILGLKKFLKYYKLFESKNVFIYAVGMEPYSEDKKENVIASNGLDLYHVRLYFLQGGMDLSKMKFPMRQLLLYGLKRSLKKEGLSEDLLEQRINNPINMVNSSNLDHMIDIYRRVIIRK
ncbi:MAG: flavodoxin domain-containing protein [Candidatus Onthovivens sp.]|nr:flavodoxin domain-containing protein [Candidatus Onthovivens sp.]